MNISNRALALSCLLCVSAYSSAQTQSLSVTVNGGQFAPGSSVTVHVGLMKSKGKLPGRLPRGYKNPIAFYEACTAKDATSAPTFDSEVFCDLADQQTIFARSGVDAVDDIAGGAAAQHAFSQQLTLPQNPAGTNLWVIVRLSYGLSTLPPGISQTLYGWLPLLYRCDGPGDVTTLASCSYYTKGGWAIHQFGDKIPLKTRKPPLP